MVRMIGPHSVTQAHLERVMYSASPDGLFDVEERHVPAMRGMGFRVAGESAGDDGDTLIEMTSPRGATELRGGFGIFRAKGGIFRIPRKFVSEAQAAGLVVKRA